MWDNYGDESRYLTYQQTAPRLIFEQTDGLQRANDVLLALRDYKAFTHQKNCSAEDAEQLREMRGDMLEYILETWTKLEEDHSCDIRVNRKVREGLARQAEEAAASAERCA